MKKETVLKYLPLLLALVLVLGCSVTLSVYDEKYAEYAVVSVSVSNIELDLTVSKTLKVVDIEKISEACGEHSETLEELENMQLDLAVRFLSEKFGSDKTIFVAASAHEESEIPLEELKSLSENATKGLTCGYVSAFAHYTDEDNARINTYGCGVGSVAWTRTFSEYCRDVFGVYIESFYSGNTNPTYIGYYINYVDEKYSPREDADPEDIKFGIQAKAENIDLGVKILTESEARERLIDESRMWYGEIVNDFSDAKLIISGGELKYKFLTMTYGYESYAYCNIISGNVNFDSEE